MTTEIKIKDIHGDYVWVAAKIVSCANPNCREERIEYTVPADSYPVTCGACGQEIE